MLTWFRVVDDGLHTFVHVVGALELDGIIEALTPVAMPALQ